MVDVRISQLVSITVKQTEDFGHRILILSFVTELNLSFTYHCLRRYASGMSGLRVSVVELVVEREQFPKSDTFAPFNATTGLVLPSKFSA